jgi:hypothetical protein
VPLTVENAVTKQPAIAARACPHCAALICLVGAAAIDGVTRRQGPASSRAAALVFPHGVPLDAWIFVASPEPWFSAQVRESERSPKRAHIPGTTLMARPRHASLLRMLYRSFRECRIRLIRHRYVCDCWPPDDCGLTRLPFQGCASEALQGCASELQARPAVSLTMIWSYPASVDGGGLR